MSLLSSLRDAARRFAGPDPSDQLDGRRQFFRRAGAVGAAAVGTGLMLPDEAWAGIEERADRFGITPGTIVDAAGNPVKDASRQDTPFLGQVVMFAGNFAPRGWAFCQGQLLSVAQNSAVFSILGTIYGGDGRNTFALPDLRGRSPIGQGTGPGLTSIVIGEKAGAEYVTLTTAQMPSHTHTIQAAGAAGDLLTPIDNIAAGDAGADANYAAATAATGAMHNPTNTGGGQQFSIRNPFLGIPYIIALQGIYPSRS